MRKGLFGSGLGVVALVCALPCGAQVKLAEGFDTVPPAGWTVVNNSNPLGTSSWFQGNSLVFSASSGSPDSYAAANFAATSGTGTISDWLIAPLLTGIGNGSTIVFFTRTVTVPSHPDRLEVRISTNGSCSPGTSETSVGDFTTLLLTVNPSLQTNGYPTAWTQYTLPLAGFVAPFSGCLAFRYFVTDGGGANGDYIGVDSLTVTAPSAKYYTVDPCRVFDTRGTGSPLAPIEVRDFQIAGNCGVPSTASAISANVFVVSPGAAGDLRIYPGGTVAPLASAINFSALQTRSNNGVFPLSLTGTVTVQSDCTGIVHVGLDVNGYFQ